MLAVILENDGPPLAAGRVHQPALMQIGIRKVQIGHTDCFVFVRTFDVFRAQALLLSAARAEEVIHAIDFIGMRALEIIAAAEDIFCG